MRQAGISLEVNKEHSFPPSSFFSPPKLCNFGCQRWGQTSKTLKQYFFCFLLFYWPKHDPLSGVRLLFTNYCNIVTTTPQSGSRQFVTFVILTLFTFFFLFFLQSVSLVPGQDVMRQPTVSSITKQNAKETSFCWHGWLCVYLSMRYMVSRLKAKHCQICKRT